MQVNNQPNYTASLQTQNRKEQKAINELASGKKDLSLDPAVQAIAQAMMSDASVDLQGLQNANDAVAMLQIADGTLQNLSNGADRLQELSVRAGSASLNADQQAMLANEYNAQVAAMRQMVDTASYNGKPLFGQSMEISLGNGSIGVTIPEMNLNDLSLGDTEALDAFRKSLEQAFSEIGSGSNALGSSIASLGQSAVTKEAAASQMADTDIAQSYQTLQTERLKTDAALFAQSHRQDLDASRIASLLQ
jgi:flagellin